MTSSGQAGDKHILERRSRAATAICGIGFGGLYLSLRLACIKQTLSGTTKITPEKHLGMVKIGEASHELKTYSTYCNRIQAQQQRETAFFDTRQSTRSNRS
ncbi:Hypothetical protein NocV09_01701780 [Nannochloropsis oceanica]